jgi:lipoprotein-anchoring transpeptidase ErfK/SrfK
MSHQPHPHRASDQHPIAAFIDRYGWRAYALPVLLTLTIVALFRAGGGHNRAEAAGHRPGVTAPSASTTGVPAAAPTITMAPDPDKPGRQYNEQVQGNGVSTPCQGNTSAKRVVVSIAAQHVWMCARSAMVFSSPVTTGASSRGHATPTGTFKVQGNVTDTTLTGSDYAVHVAYWIEFNGDIGFHDASWQTMTFGTQAYKNEGSRGCVHMPLPTITWLHKWVQVGQTVVTVTKA